jgi:hypothetical protein
VAISGKPATPAEHPSAFHAQISGPTLYSIGNVTGDEQYLLELLNRARGNATAEAKRIQTDYGNATTTLDGNITGAITYFKVNLDTMVDQFGNLTQNLQPLAFNQLLMMSANLHTDDMLVNNFQGHQNSANPPGGLTPNITDASLALANRLTFVTYPYNSAAENVFSYGLDLNYIHASFEIDWGNDTLGAVDGMQVPPGHRINDHSNYREIGIVILPGPGNGSNLSIVGPKLVTYDFGLQNNDTPIITGVVYQDANANNFYDSGEGVGNVTVSVSGASYYAVTAPSGGYSIPVPGDGNYTVTFTGGGLPEYSTNVTVSNNNNLKVDYVISVPTLAPVITTQPLSQNIAVNATVTFTVVASGPSLAYQWSFNNKKISGATSANYTIAKVATTNVGNYTVFVSNSHGNITSQPSVLSVFLPAPVIQTFSDNLVSGNGTIIAGQPVTFSVSASGSGLKYQWQVTINGKTTNISGATKSTYTISKTALANSGNYSVVVSNVFNKVTQSVSPASDLPLNVVTLPTFKTQPKAQSVHPGGTAKFFVVATATPPITTYAWYQNGAALSDGVFSGVNVFGSNTSNLTLSSVTTSLNGFPYQVKVTNSVGTTPSASVKLTVK